MPSADTKRKKNEKKNAANNAAASNRNIPGYNPIQTPSNSSNQGSQLSGRGVAVTPSELPLTPTGSVSQSLATQLEPPSGTTGYGRRNDSSTGHVPSGSFQGSPSQTSTSATPTISGFTKSPWRVHGTNSQAASFKPNPGFSTSSASEPHSAVQQSQSGPAFHTNVNVALPSQSTTQATGTGDATNAAGRPSWFSLEAGNHSANTHNQPSKTKTEKCPDFNVRNFVVNSGHGVTQKSAKKDDVVVTSFCSNHFQVDTAKTEDIYVYPVNIIQEVKPERVRERPQRRPRPTQNPATAVKVPARKTRRLFALLLQGLASTPSPTNTQLASNYKTQIVAMQAIDFDNIQFPVIARIQYFDEHQDKPSDDPYVYEIQISAPNVLHVGRLQRSLLRKVREGERPFTHEEIKTCRLEYENALNIVFSQFANQQPDLAVIGASKYFQYIPGEDGLANHTRDIKNGLCAVPGFSRSIRVVRERPLQLNVNSTTSAFYRWTNLQQLLSERIWRQLLGRRPPVRDMRFQDLSSRQWKELQHFVSQLKVRKTFSNRAGRQEEYTLTGLAMTEDDVAYDEAQSKKVLRPKTWPWAFEVAPLANRVSFYKSVRDNDNEPKRDEHGMLIKQNRATLILDYYRKDLHRGEVHKDDIVVRAKGGEAVLYFPASVLEVLPGQHWKQAVDIAEHAARSPAKNRDDILTLGKHIFGLSTDIERDFGMKLANQGNFLQVHANRLKVPDVVYQNEKIGNRMKFKGKGKEEVVTRWNLSNLKCFRPAESSHQVTQQQQSSSTYSKAQTTAAQSKSESTTPEWSFLEFVPSDGHRANDENWSSKMLGDFIGNFSNALRNFGLDFRSNVDDPDTGYASHKIFYSVDFPAQAMQDFTEILKKYDDIKFWVVLLPKKHANQELYTQIKISADIMLEKVTLCHVKSNRWSGNGWLQACSNMCMKLNLKLGHKGVNQSLKEPSRLLKEHAMVVGIDVTHAGGGAMHNAPSVAAMVASHDRTYAQWPASIRLNPREEGDSRQVREDVEHLGSMILERLDQFKKENNNQLPERIVIYRDGLSESQFAMAVDTELGRILVGLRSLYGTAIPNILLVCAVKSHDTRLFPLQLTKTQRRKDDDYQIHDNPAVGTVVYDTVTYGEGQDFFLYSQNAMQVSTLRPTRYVVLFNNDQTVSIEDVAKMTMDLCFIYGRATMSVGLATPAYYAHHAAFRARKYMHEYYKRDYDRDDDATFDYERLASTIQLQPRGDYGERMFYI